MTLFNLNYMSLSGGLTFLLSLSVAGFVYFKNKNAQLNLAWALFSFFVSAWGLGICLAFGFFNYKACLFFSRYLNLVAIFIPLFFFKFTLLYVNQYKGHRKLFNFLYVGISIYITSILTNPSLFIKTVEPKLSFSLYPVAGPVYWIFALYFSSLVTISVWKLFKKYQSSQDKERKKDKLLLISIIIGFSGGSTTFPLVFGIPIYPYGVLGPVLLSVIVGYTITKYNLLNIKVIITHSIAKLTTLTLLNFVYIYALQITSFTTFYMVVFSSLYLTMSLLVFNSLVNFFLTPLEKKFLKGYYDIQQIISDLSTDLIVARDVKTVLKTISVKLSSEVETDQSYFIFREMPDSRMALFKESENEPFHEFKDEDPIIEYFHEHNEPIAFGKIPVAVKESISQLPISEKSLWFPIKSINQLHGIFILGKKLTGDKYTETDYHMVKAVMNQLLVVFDRNHMHQQLVKEKDRNQSYIKQLEVVKKDKEQIDKDLERASKVQKRTLPQKSLLISDYNIETQFVPSDKVSGDYYSYFKFNENEYGFLIADAVGHGVTAALNSMIFKSILEKTLDGLRSPKEVLELLNQTIYINPSFTQYMPVIYGKLNTKTNTFTYANAGHHAGLAYINNQFKELESGGPPLGMSDDETFEEEILQLNDNDLTLLYSDGLEDGRNEKGEEFGRTGVEKVVRRYRDSAQEESFTTLMLDTWSKYKLEDGKQKDDMAYIFIEHVKEQFFSNS